MIGDDDQLAQVFQNLIDNAIKYTRDNTEVRVTLTVKDGRRSGPMVSIAVADCGEGIARTHLPRLTERFYRVDPARSRALGGTGLGLAIVKHIVNRHRGQMTIESDVGKGSTFTVLLPVAADAVLELERDWEERSRLAREQAEKFDWGRSAEILLELLLRV